MTRVLRLLAALAVTAAVMGAAASRCESVPPKPPDQVRVELTVTGPGRAHITVTVAGKTRMDRRRALPWSQPQRVQPGDRVTLTATFVDPQVGDRLTCRIWDVNGHTLDNDAAEYPLDAAAECATTIGEPV